MVLRRSLNAVEARRPRTYSASTDGRAAALSPFHRIGGRSEAGGVNLQGIVGRDESKQSTVSSGTSVPDFFVIGAYRSGTTAIYRMLRQHPDVYLPSEKEPNFYAVDGNPDASATLRSRSVCDRREYAALYAGRREGQRTGDISPEYLRNPWAPARLHEAAPGAPLVAILRNPVDRAYSDYLLHRRDGDEPLPTFAAAVAAQSGRALTDDRAGHYLDTGFYGEQLERYLQIYPRRQLQVHLYEDLLRDRNGVLEQIFAHIGVDSAFRPSAEEPVNASGEPNSRALALALRGRHRLRPFVPREVLERARPVWERYLATRLRRPAMEDRDRARLCELYRDDVQRLAQLLGRDLTHWLEN